MSKLMPHVMERLYSAEMDFGCYDGEQRLTYMLATIPRSGSTYCAIRLWQTGLLGAPMEYLNFRFVGDILRRLDYVPHLAGEISEAGIAKYWGDIKRLRTSPNGVFGYKMFGVNYLEISRRVPGFLRQIVPDYVIYLTRRDLIGQAMSYSRAQRSRRWFAGMPDTPEVRYDFEHIKQCISSIEDQKSSWERMFAITGVRPIHICYEDLLADSAGVIRALLLDMDIPPEPADELAIPLIERQTDGVSREWRDRFAEDSARELAISAVTDE